MEIFREITPLTQNDCFTLFSRHKSSFDFPLHTHEEFELNLILHAKNAKRVIGDHIDLIDDAELVFIGSNLPHAWFTEKCTSENIHEITIQFNRDLIDEKFLQKKQLGFMRAMFEKSFNGVLFSQETILRISPRIIALAKKTGFDSVLELLSILHDLSTSRNMITLSTGVFFNNNNISYSSRRVQKVMEYLNNNFSKEVSLTEAAKIASMTEVSFSRFFKTKTGQTFIDTLNEIRLGNATRMLMETSQGVAEIAYLCGFNNISNFNRIFKKRKGNTPKEFRESFSGTRIFI
ncbi:helix-turn-helix domain-containing protein [Arachidicoccus soli]|uniref:AraC family transcriptional regulator n=1 Tax=Arachidicoccus soli TaxID=2341117 RepID=A0A386HMW0_9BACT|nr:AraC family transcriptional regulator [Arachidicoccus soli]AYD47083.1 AraC family transcriptional regulator [Arachidicoccus soli]